MNSFNCPKIINDDASNEVKALHGKIVHFLSTPNASKDKFYNLLDYAMYRKHLHCLVTMYDLPCHYFYEQDIMVSVKSNDSSGARLLLGKIFDALAGIIPEPPLRKH